MMQGQTAPRACPPAPLKDEVTLTPAEHVIQSENCCFSFRDACRVAEEAARATGADQIEVDLRLAAEATTAAFARLIQLRRTLLANGRDLHLILRPGRLAYL